MSKATVFESNPFTVLIEGIKAVFTHTQTMAVALLVAPFALGIVSLFVQLILEVLQSSFDKDTSAIVIGIGVLLFIGAFLLQIYLQIMLVGMAWLTGLRSAKQKDLSFGDAFSLVMEKFWKLVAISALVFLYASPYFLATTFVVTGAIVAVINDHSLLSMVLPITCVVVVLLIVQMIRVYTRYTLAPFALFDLNTTSRQAMRRSKQLSKGRLVEIFNISLIGSFIPVISTVLIASGLGRTYVQRSSQADIAALPSIHKSNYIVLVVLGVIMLIATMLMVGILAVISNLN